MYVVQKLGPLAVATGVINPYKSYKYRVFLSKLPIYKTIYKGLFDCKKNRWVDPWPYQQKGPKLGPNFRNIHGWVRGTAWSRSQEVKLQSFSVRKPGRLEDVDSFKVVATQRFLELSSRKFGEDEPSLTHIFQGG